MAKSTRSLLAFAASAALAYHGFAASSASYQISADSVDSAGGNTTSASYAQVGSAGTLPGTGTSSGAFARHGFVGMLAEPAGFSLLASPDTVGETETRALSAILSEDDATITLLPPEAVDWSVISGPVALITGSGVVHTTSVYQPTLATVQGLYGGFAVQIDLTVLDTLPDNYKTYAGDGLGDLWQVTYFGENNPLAAPGVDASGVGYDNRFKYLAGLNPVDRNAPNGRFHFNLELVPGQPAVRRVVFSPRYADRTYTVLYSDDLATWQPIPAPVVIDSGETRRVTDTTASGTRRFYKVDVALP